MSQYETLRDFERLKVGDFIILKDEQSLQAEADEGRYVSEVQHSVTAVKEFNTSYFTFLVFELDQDGLAVVVRECDGEHDVFVCFESFSGSRDHVANTQDWLFKEVRDEVEHHSDLSLVDEIFFKEDDEEVVYENKGTSWGGMGNSFAGVTSYSALTPCVNPYIFLTEIGDCDEMNGGKGGYLSFLNGVLVNFHDIDLDFKNKETL